MVQITSLLTVALGLVGTTLATSSNTGLLQMLTYVKRHPNMTRAEFWEYWDTQHAPKIQVGGKIVPTDAGASAPASNNLVDFDGVAMFLYESADDLTAMLSHPYYIDVVEPDEHVFIDKSAYGNGMVATYIGENIEVVDDERSVWVGDEKTRNKYQRLFKSYR
ncbi:hypothetical protein FGRA07_02486 [Fusarium graminearum]|nr:hypothetical protein FGRA07_02486 [Fusarium graminearum]